MSFVKANRVQERSTTTGTGNIALAGAYDGTYRTFGSQMANGDTCQVLIINEDAVEWEIDEAQYVSASNAIQRSTFIDSSTGSTVSFGSGTKRVAMLPIASSTVVEDNTGVATVSAGMIVAGANVATTLVNVAAVKALTERPLVVVTQGYSAAGDGGGGAFWWNAGSSTTANDGTIIQPTAGAAGRYKRIFSGDIEAAWFGYVADNSTDNSAFLQAAYDAAALIGANVKLPGGRAKLASTVNLNSHASIIGLGWEDTILVPQADSITTMFNVTGSSASIIGIEIDASAVVAPTFTAVKWNSGGFNKISNVWIYGAGTGILFPQGNACTIGPDVRIQECPIGVQTGGTTLIFPGDTTWRDVVILPTTAGTGIIMDGNTNAQRMHHVLVAGGATSMDIRGSGASTGIPDGIYLTDSCNFTQTTGAVLKIEKGYNVHIEGSTTIGASSGAEGVLINASTASDVDGVVIDNAMIRANAKEGVKANNGTNIFISGSQIYGNSQAGSGTYSNVYIGASWRGLVNIVSNMLGISNATELFANIQGPSKYGVELAASSVTTSGAVIGRVYISDNMVQGNTTGTISDGSTPTYKYIQSNQAPTVVTKTSNYPLVAATESTVLCTTNAFTVTLPTAVGLSGQVLTVKNGNTLASGNFITIATTGGQTIDGGVAGTIAPLTSVSFLSDGSNWWTV